MLKAYLQSVAWPELDILELPAARGPLLLAVPPFLRCPFRGRWGLHLYLPV